MPTMKDRIDALRQQGTDATPDTIGPASQGWGSNRVGNFKVPQRNPPKTEGGTGKKPSPPGFYDPGAFDVK